MSITRILPYDLLFKIAPGVYNAVDYEEGGITATKMMLSDLEAEILGQE